MGSRRSLRFFLFVFDALRLVAVVSALSAFRSLFSAPGGGSLGANAVAFAAPQALFPLMAFFSWLDPVRYAPYPPLYAAGKTISAAAIGAWLLDSTEDALMAVGLGNTGAVLLAAVSAAVLLYDLVSALITVYIIRFDDRAAGAAGKVVENGEAGENRPAIIVETVPEVSSSDTSGAQAADAQGGA
jgi:hypothetical protein